MQKQLYDLECERAKNEIDLERLEQETKDKAENDRLLKMRNRKIWETQQRILKETQAVEQMF